MAVIEKKDIDYLFDDLWSGMLYVTDHKIDCMKKFDSIQNYFIKYPSNRHDELLQGLCSLDGIGVTIGTGLIWAAHRRIRVPFDKYTLTYALKLELIRSERVTENYLEFCKKIKKYCDTEKCSVQKFVRDARIDLEGSEYLMEPR
jgi:hypothetical protein